MRLRLRLLGISHLFRLATVDGHWLRLERNQTGDRATSPSVEREDSKICAMGGFELLIFPRTPFRLDLKSVDAELRSICCAGGRTPRDLQGHNPVQVFCAGR